MDYRAFVEYHVDTGADITMAVQPASADMAPASGILKRGTDGRIDSFTEKPESAALAGLENIQDSDKPYLASMGIYVFHTDLLFEVFKFPGDDFGKDIIPKALADYRVMGHVYDGYWADIGTIRRFYEVNLEMALPDRPFDFYIPGQPIYSRARFLPATEVYGARIENALLADGCRVADAQINHAVIGLRSQIGPKTQIRSSVLMGADYYETETDRAWLGRAALS
jgi:glucose-1-phosphate adenylyltransferase